jgi:hypothetical protein
MTDALPDHIVIASYLLGDFADGLAGAVERYRFLMCLDADFGADFVMLPGGTASGQAYVEARASYVSSNFLATIVLSQGFLENLLGAHLVIQEGIQPIHGFPTRQSGPLADRPSIREILGKAAEDGLILNSMVPRIEKLIGLRNPLIHHRSASDKSSLFRRAMAEDVAEATLLEADAKFAIGLVVEIAHVAMQNAIPKYQPQ